MWLTLIFAETIAAQSGIGYMAMQAREFMQTDVDRARRSCSMRFSAKERTRWRKALERWRLAWHPAFQKAA